MTTDQPHHAAARGLADDEAAALRRREVLDRLRPRNMDPETTARAEATARHLRGPS